jgi:hypothetical protein
MAKKWNQEEDDLLEKFVNTVTVLTIVEKLGQLNSDRDIKRSEATVRARLQKLGYSVKATENNMSCFLWGRMLGISFRKIRRWTKNHGLSFEEQNCQIHVSRKAMIALAKRKPQFFAEIKKDILISYFGADLTERILTIYYI